MGTVQQNLARTELTKGEIRNAIIAQGVLVPADTKFREYPNKIREITAGHIPPITITYIYIDPSTGEYDRFYQYYEYGEDATLPSALLYNIPAIPGVCPALTCQGFNYLESELTNLQHNYTVGVQYIPADGFTHIFVDVPEDDYDLTVHVGMSGTGTTGVSYSVGIDFGDGTIINKPTNNYATPVTHTYVRKGRYEVVLRPVGSLSYMTLGASSSTSLIGGADKNQTSQVRYIYVAEDRVRFNTYCFAYMTNLVHATLPQNMYLTTHSYMFYYCFGLKYCVIPRSVKSIANNFLFFCNSLEAISIPPTVTTAGSAMLRLAYNVENIDMPDSITTIETQAFSNMYNLKTMYISRNVVTLGTEAFSNNEQLGELTDMPNLTTVGVSAFASLTSLKKVGDLSSVVTVGSGCFNSLFGVEELPPMPNLTTIGTYFCASMQNLKELHLGDNIVTPSSPGTGVLSLPYRLETFTCTSPGFTKAGNDFLYGTRIMTTCVLPPNLTTVGSSFLGGAQALTFVELPATLTNIGGSSMNDLYRMQTMLSHNPVPPVFATTGLANLNPKVKIYVPDASVAAYKVAPVWSNYANNIKPMSEYVDSPTFMMLKDLPLHTPIGGRIISFDPLMSITFNSYAGYATRASFNPYNNDANEYVLYIDPDNQLGSGRFAIVVDSTYTTVHDFIATGFADFTVPPNTTWTYGFENWSGTIPNDVLDKILISV